MTQYTLDNTDDIFLTYIETWEPESNRSDDCSWSNVRYTGQHSLWYQ